MFYLKKGDVVDLIGAVVSVHDVNLEDGNGFFVGIEHGKFLLADNYFQSTRIFPDITRKIEKLHSHISLVKIYPATHEAAVTTQLWL